MSGKNSKKYAVLVDDNYHFMDESERYKSGEFDDCEAAKQHCMAIVDAALQHAYQPGMAWDALLQGYLAFGEDPWISSPDANCQFSASAYAEQRCRALCRIADE